MPIVVRCACGKEYHFKDEYAGRRAKCPACGQVVRIPGTRPPGTPMPRRPSREASPEGEQSRTVVLAALGFAGFVILVGIGLVVYFLFFSGPAPRARAPAASSPATQQPSAAASQGPAPASGPPAPAAAPVVAPGPSSVPSPSAIPASPPPPAPPAPASAAMSAVEILRRLGDQEVAFTDFAEERMADPLWMLGMFDSKTLTHWADFLKDDPGPLDLTFQLKVPLAADRVATLLGAKPTAEEKGNFNLKDASENPPSVVPTPVTYLRYGEVGFAANDAGSVVGLTVQLPARGPRPSPLEGLRRVLGIGVAAPPGYEEESEADEIGKRGDVMLKGILAALGLAKEPMQVTHSFVEPLIVLEPQNPKPLDHYRRTLGPEEGQRTDDRGGNPITWYTYGWLEVGVRDGAAAVMVVNTDRLRAVARAFRSAPAAPPAPAPGPS